MLVVKVGRSVIVKEKITFGPPKSRESFSYFNRNSNASSENSNPSKTMPGFHPKMKMKDQYPQIAVLPRLPNPNQPEYNLKLIGEKLSFVSKTVGDLHDIIGRLCPEEGGGEDLSNLNNTLDNGYSQINSHINEFNKENENFEKIISNIESINNKDKNLMIMHVYGMKDNSSISENKELLNLIKTYKSKLISSID